MLDLEKERDHPYWVTMLNMMHCSFAFCCWFHNYEVVGVVLRLGVDLLAAYLFVSIYLVLLITTLLTFLALMGCE